MINFYPQKTPLKNLIIIDYKPFKNEISKRNQKQPML